MKATIRVLCLSALVCAAGCTDGRGNVQWGETALLGVAAGGLTALAGGALADSARPRHGYGRGGYNRGGYGYEPYRRPSGYDGGHGYGRGWGF